MGDLDRIWLVSRADCLGDTHVLTAVGPDGAEQWLLAEPGHHCHDCPIPATPEHEDGGRLRREVRARIWPCLATTRTRRPCSNPAEPGTDRCYAHRGRPTQTGDRDG